MANAMTKGIDHVGLTVSNLSKSVDFFVNGLGWAEVGSRPAYPATFVSDGNLTLTLWQVDLQTDYVTFDRRKNIGLHHLALRVTDPDELVVIFEKIKAWDGVEVEFAPELSGNGPKRHFMIYEPGGNRIEFAWDPRRS